MTSKVEEAADNAWENEGPDIFPSKETYKRGFNKGAKWLLDRAKDKAFDYTGKGHLLLTVEDLEQYFKPIEKDIEKCS